jgi:hypothetical protein
VSAGLRCAVSAECAWSAGRQSVNQPVRLGWLSVRLRSGGRRLFGAEALNNCQRVRKHWQVEHFVILVSDVAGAFVRAEYNFRCRYQSFRGGA